MTGAEPTIRVHGVSKVYHLFDSPGARLKEALHPLRRRYHHEHWALRGIDLEVFRGQTVGILGSNGSGKSTLLQVIAQILQPTQGTAEISGRLSALLELGSGFNAEFTGRENVLMNGAIHGVPRKVMRDLIPAIEKFSEIGKYFDHPVKTYSSGMFVRVAFSTAIHVDPEILIIDEALAVGDARFQEKCYRRIQKIQESGATVLFVSHSTSVIRTLCQRAIVLKDGNKIFDGSAEEGCNVYEADLFGGTQQETHKKDEPLDIERPAPEGGSNVDSETAHAVNHFLAAGQQKLAHTRRSYNPSCHITSDGRGEIVDYLIVTHDLVDPIRLDGQTPISIYVRFVAHSPITSPVFGFSISNNKNMQVFGSNTSMWGQEIAPMQAGQLLCLRFDIDLRLLGGAYFISLGCSDHSISASAHVDRVRSLAMLEINPTPHSDGVAGFNTTMTEIDLSEF